MTSIQSEVPPMGSVAKMINRLSKVEEPIVRIAESNKKQLQIVLFEYKATQDDEIDLEVDDIIEVIRPVEDGWNKGKVQRTGATGMYPTNYCENYKPKSGVIGSKLTSYPSSTKKTNENIMSSTDGDSNVQPCASKRISSIDSSPPILSDKVMNPSSSPSIQSIHPSISSTSSTSSKEYAKVTFVYEAQHSDELSLLEVGQLVEITSKNTGDPGWFEGELNGKKGLFPDNFVELVKVPIVSNVISSQSNHSHITPTSSSSTSFPSTSTSTSNILSSSRINDKPPASLPGAVSVMSFPPQVPAKPSKSTLPTSISSTMNIIGGGMSNTSTTITSTTISNGIKTSNNNNGEEDKEKEKKVVPSSFSEKRNALLANLNMHNPQNVKPVGMSKSSTKIDEDVNEDGIDEMKPLPVLTHPTKTRPKVPSGVRRPVSMMNAPSQFNTIDSSSRDIMTRSEYVIHETTTSSDKPVAISATRSISPIVKNDHSISPSNNIVKDSEGTSHSNATCSSSISRSISSDITPTLNITTDRPHISLSPSIPSSSQYVTITEYNEVLAKLALLEARVAALERR